MILPRKLKPLEAASLFLRLLRKGLSFVQKPIFARLTGKDFAKALAAGAAKYDTSFTPRESWQLERASARPDFRTHIRAICPSARPLENPEVTFVIYDVAGWDILQRCLFILAKQQTRMQVIIVGRGKRPLTGLITGVRDITWIAVRKPAASCFFHVLATPHVRGTYVCFLRSTDVVHPSFFACLSESLSQHPQALAACRLAGADTPLPGLVSHDAVEIRTAEEDIRSDGGISGRLNDALLHVLFDTQRWKKALESTFSDEDAPWLPLLHTLAYARACGQIALCPHALVRETPVPWTLSDIRYFTAGLKEGTGALEKTLHALLGAGDGERLFRRLLFNAIPLELSRRIVKSYGPFKASVFYSNVAFYLAQALRRYPEDARELMARTFAGLHYGRFMASVRVQALHHCRILLSEARPEGIVLYDEQSLPDLKNHLLAVLAKHYTVTCLEKSSFVAFRQLELMTHAVLVSRRVLIISSILVHQYMNAGRKTLLAWHGGGFLKKNYASDEQPRFPHEYMLASSQECRTMYPAIYEVPEEHILPFGSVQTDRYFSARERELARARAFEEFPDIRGKRVCFFAPTFRQYHKHRGYSDPPSYFCGWDLQAFDDALEKSGTVIIFKNHQKLKNARQNLGRNICDLRDSPRGFIRETALEDIFDWVCACDLFMTDYSSAMLYPLLLDKPLLLYAPDLTAYLNEGNGFYIDYEHTVPGPIVQSPAPEALIEAMGQAESMVGSERYRAFKNTHMGACDGRAAERLLDFLESWYPAEKKRLERE